MTAGTTAMQDDYQLTGNVDGTSINFSSFVIGGKTATVTLSALQNGDSNTETLVLKTICAGPTATATFTINPASGGNGDPHFDQLIKDATFNDTKQICYDISGGSNDIIQILNEPKKLLKIYGQLKDDYYLHKIFIDLYLSHIEVNIHEIIILPDLKKNWNQIEKKIWTEFSNFHFTLKTQKRKKILFFDFHDKISFAIKKNMNELGNFYLDILIFGLTTDYSGKDGLIGRIGNNKITIYPSIQESMKTTIIVNNHKSFGYKKKRNGRICYLIDVKYLLYPYRLENYIRNPLKS